MRKTPRCFQGILAAILLSLLIPTPLVTAQGSAGQIEGIVRDEQGGVLPGVTLTVRNQETGVARTLVTQADGRYVLQALQPGRYSRPSCPALRRRSSPTWSSRLASA
jgi:Carboxypeptidase regulatory-like domain